MVAESIVDSRDYKEGRRAAFRLLFAYISGENKIVPDISLTSKSASINGESHEISMTSPVEVSRAAISRVRMRFFLPPEYSLGSAPEPINPDVNVVEIPARVEAVLRFSGFAGEDAIKEMTQRILRELEGSPWYPSGKPVTYSYDPPWTLPFLRRHEISVVVRSYAE